MPRRAMCSGVSRVMSMPLNRICPRVGVRNLVSRLKQVVLPAPFGPDQRVDRPAPHLEVDVVDRDEALELLRQAARLENDFGWRYSCGGGEHSNVIRVRGNARIGGMAMVLQRVARHIVIQVGRDPHLAEAARAGPAAG